jgi:rSAM/selenodomain-associated transferase 1
VSRCAIAVMARAPSSPGKTRLSPHYSEARLRALRAALLADTLLVVAAVPAVDPYIFFTPDDAEQEISALAAGSFELIAQRGADLGQRMQSAVRDLVDSRGHTAAILVGSDIPALSVECLAEARDTVESNGGVVIGPADDGGYYLIGMRVVYAELFRDVEWGCASVLSDTLRAAARAGVEARLIRGAYDIDTIDDLRRLERDLATASTDVAPNIRRWMDEGR